MTKDSGKSPDEMNLRRDFVMQFQQTLRKNYTFEGKGLHTGKIAKMTICPAESDTGIRFRRTDIGEDAFIDAVAEELKARLSIKA